MIITLLLNVNMGTLRKLYLIFVLGHLGHIVCDDTMSQSYDTIVIGMGAAGTAAASTLAKAGKRVLALEAQDRVGGRVHTVPFGDGVVEVGAEWIHGTEGSPVYETAIKNNIMLVPQDFQFVVYRSDGTVGDDVLVNDLMNFCLEVVHNPGKNPEPLGRFITERLMKYITEKYPDLLKDQDFINEFLEMMNLVINNYESSNDWNDVSTLSNYTELEGHQHMSWNRHGYKTFFELLLNTYKNGPGWPTLDIKLNKEVTLIKWPQNANENVEVTCKDGDVYTADNVIVTVSLGVLKERHSSLFAPALPSTKRVAIEKVAIGVMDKVIIKFDNPFLPGGIFYGFLWKGEDKEKVNKEDYWMTRIFGCSTPMGSNGVVTFWTSGETGKMVETLPEDVVKTKCMELLRKFMGKNITIPDPTGMIRSTWYSNPFTRGSYSYDNLLVADHPWARGELSAPLRDLAGKPRVLFAGEATDLMHFSTVHGATDSGYREAARLLPNSKL